MKILHLSDTHCGHRRLHNPPVRDEKTIFEVIEYDVEDLDEDVLDHYTKFRVYDFRIGFGMTLSEAESVMRCVTAEREKEGKEIYCFHIKEYPIGQSLDSGFGDYGTSWRLYDSKGVLLDRTYCSDLRGIGVMSSDVSGGVRRSGVGSSPEKLWRCFMATR